MFFKKSKNIFLLQLLLLFIKQLTYVFVLFSKSKNKTLKTSVPMRTLVK